ncbi:MAG: BrnA antitoxin family protein [Proteobacteria bacterium]|nr:BrnA antitoxin family protein [Pseudomonadota bacterium]
MATDREISKATRRVLFKPEEIIHGEEEIPGAGTSAATRPERHIRAKVTMNVDGDILGFFKDWAQKEGRPYQGLINQVLREYVDGSRPDKLAKSVSEILLNDPKFLEAVKSKANELKTK